MFWADKVAQELKKRQLDLEWVDDMKTPSGRIHVGSLRGVVLHDLIFKALKEAGVKAKFTYVFDDQDPMDDIPVYLDQKIYKEYLGKPLNRIPPPQPGFDSYGQFFAQEFKKVFNTIGSDPKIIWGSKLYASGKMNWGIKLCLDQVQTIRDIYNQTYERKLAKNWYPFQVICPNCGKLSTTKVTGWDGKEVQFVCLGNEKMGIKGCGLESQISPFDGNGKLSWKIEWAVKWKTIGVTVEGAGKDHMTAGGSHDISQMICEQVINYPVPYPFAYEFFLVAGKKMSSSRGLGTSAKEIAAILPPELLRFIMVRYNINEAINFDPRGMTIPNLYDDYDDYAHAYYGKKKDNRSRVFYYSQIDKIPAKKTFLPRFRDVANYVQLPSVDIYQKFAQIKGSSLTAEDKKELDKRIKYARIWLKSYAPEETKTAIVAEKPTTELTKDQKQYLKLILPLLAKKWTKPEDLQQSLYDTAKDNKLNPKIAFQGIYLALTNKPFGPKAAWFLLDLDKKTVKDKFMAAIKFVSQVKKVSFKYPLIKANKFVCIKEDMAKAYPSIKIAMAVIRGVDNNPDNKKFQAYRDQVVTDTQGITLTDISDSIKIKSYRQAIRESGIDWHKRRPTMEALLRRVAQKKELYWINPLVDIANLMAMKHQMSEGIFDLDKLNLPTIMQKSAGGEKVLMLGDKKPITLQKGEICYFDRKGPFIVDLCWRDSQRTSATPKTKDVLFLSEGVYDITRKDLDIMLDDTIKTVTKYLGGKVETAGILTAK